MRNAHDDADEHSGEVSHLESATVKAIDLHVATDTYRQNDVASRDDHADFVLFIQAGAAHAATCAGLVHPLRRCLTLISAIGDPAQFQGEFVMEFVRELAPRFLYELEMVGQSVSQLDPDQLLADSRDALEDLGTLLVPTAEMVLLRRTQTDIDWRESLSNSAQALSLRFVLAAKEESRYADTAEGRSLAAAVLYGLTVVSLT